MSFTKMFININNLYILEEVNINMLFMVLFWTFLAIAIILWIINIKIKSNGLDGAVGFFIFMQFVLLVIAISTKDPIFQDIGIPIGYEWVVGLLAGGFGLWLYYLNPLKNRVTETEKKVERIDSKVTEIKEDVSWIKSNCNVSFKKNK